MTELVLQFLQYGAPAERIGNLTPEVTAPFLQSLAVSASDSPALMPYLLPSLYSFRQVRIALVYAGLDYVEIGLSVVQAEAETSAAAENCVEIAASDNAAAGLEQEDDLGGEDSKESLWQWENDDEVDECYAFEVADEEERTRLAILSVRRRAREFALKANGGSGGAIEEEFSQLHRERDEGSMWSSEACLPELMCLLPVAASRCPTLLSPEILVKGLLSASCGCPLLVATLANNPGTLERGILTMARTLSREIENLEGNRPGSPESAATSGKAVGGGGSGTLSREHSGSQFHELAPPVLTSNTHAEVVIPVIIGLCSIAPSFAAICREALVNTCTLAEVVLHITSEVFHDELEFLSSLIFPKEKTSSWILAFLGANQRHSDSQPVVVLGSLSKNATDATTDTKEIAVSQSTTKGLATRILDALLGDAKSTWKKQGWCGRLHSHLRLYCVLIRAGDLQPTHEEIDFWLRILGGTMDQTGSGELRQSVNPFVSERTLQLGICFVCLVPGLSSPPMKTLFHACIANLLRAAMGNANYAACTPEVELAVWVAVQLLLRRFADVAGLVREALGMHVTVHTASMRDLADAAVAAAVLSDPYIAASAAASLRPPGPVPSCRKQQCLGLKCLEQLLSTNNFTRCGVDISEAVRHYICIAEEPIHPVLPIILHGYTDLSVPAPRGRGGLPRFRMRPFSRDVLVKAMAPGFAILRGSLSANAQNRNIKNARKKNGQGDPVATAALITYYVLCREQILRNMGISVGSNNDYRNSSVDDSDDGWWTNLLGWLPLRELLMYMENNWPAYEHLLPQWLCAASVVFPERFTAQTLLRDLENTDTSFQIYVKDVPVTEDLDWAGPHHGTSLQNIEGEFVRATSAEVPTERIAKSDVDVDMEQDVVLSEPSINAKQEAATELSSVGLDEGNAVVNTNVISLETITAVMGRAVDNPLPAMRILKAMTTGSGLVTGSDDSEDVGSLTGFGVRWRLGAAMMKALIPNLLESSCPRCLQDQFCSWWQSLPSSTLEYLVPVLWDLVRDPSIPSSGNSVGLVGGQQNIQFRLPVKRAAPALVTLSSSGFAEEPLKFLALNVKVFRSPLLGILLDLLLELLITNRRICQAAASEGGRDAGIKKEEVTAALVAQDSAVCQILLEACLPKNELDDERRSGPMLEARRLICATLSSMFYRSTLLLKLLHFQGYDIQLIPMMVEGAPVMVKCLDFIGELLQQSQQHQQVFAVVLTAQLTSFHPDLPQSLTAAQQVVGQVTQMRTKVAGCASYLQEVLGAIAQCASTFPSLATQVVALLQSCAQAGGPLTPSGPPRDAALHSAAVAAFKYLVQSKLLHGRPPPAI